jgi:type VI secretion system secreted protein Hcp
VDKEKAAMPSDYYLKLDGIDGESQAADMEKTIELESWSFGAGSAASLGGKGLSAGKPSFSDFNCSFPLDTASPKILGNLTKGTHIATATFTGRKTGGDAKPYKYLEITMTKVFVTGFSLGGGSVGTPSASVSLAFEQIKYEYFAQDTGTGGVTSVGSATYDIKQVQAS